MSDNTKRLPGNEKLEKAVLGAILLNPELYDDATRFLNPEIFSNSQCGMIFRAMTNCILAGNTIDFPSIENELTRLKHSELSPVLYDIIGAGIEPENFEAHCANIRGQYVKKILALGGGSIVEKAFDPACDFTEVLEVAEKAVMKAGEVISEVGAEKDFAAQMDSIAHEIEQRIDKPYELTGVPSGFVQIDNLTSGWQPSDLIIIAARPGMGKTAFALEVGRNAAASMKSIAVFSLEMSAEQLVSRMLSGETEIDSEKFKKKYMSHFELKKVKQAITKLRDSKIYIDDTPALSILALRSKLRRWKRQYGIDMAIVDYLQLMTSGDNKNQSQEQEVSAISRGLKAIAKDLSIPVIALSQLSRSVETRTGSKRPILSDIRGSGSVEQDADLVMFLYRPEYYGLTTDDEGQPVQPGLTEAIFAKNRSGRTGTAEIKFIGKYTKFTNLDGDDPAAIDFIQRLTPSKDFDDAPPF